MKQSSLVKQALFLEPPTAETIGSKAVMVFYGR